MLLQLLFALLLDSLLKFHVDVGKQNRHQEVETYDQEANKGKATPVILIVGGQHNVWEVCRCQQDHNVVERVGQAVKKDVPCVVILVDEKAKVRVKKHEQENACKDH